MIQHDDVGIDRILADVFTEALAQRSDVNVMTGGLLPQKRADFLVARQKADVGGALKQISHQDIDGDLRLGAVVLQALLERLASQLVEQPAGEFAERAARFAHVGSGAGQLPEQSQVVPDRLQMLERAAVLFRGCDMRDNSLQISVEIDPLKFDGHEIQPVGNVPPPQDTHTHTRFH